MAATITAYYMECPTYYIKSLVLQVRHKRQANGVLIMEWTLVNDYSQVCGAQYTIGCRYVHSNSL